MRRSSYTWCTTTSRRATLPPGHIPRLAAWSLAPAHTTACCCTHSRLCEGSRVLRNRAQALPPGAGDCTISTAAWRQARARQVYLDACSWSTDIQLWTAGRRAAARRSRRVILHSCIARLCESRECAWYQKAALAKTLCSVQHGDHPRRSFRPPR
jgi:hypothetical protein